MTDPLDINRELDFDLDLIGRYVAGAVSPAERRAIEGWIAADSERYAMVAQLRAVWRQTGVIDVHDTPDDDEVDVETHLRALHQAIEPAVVALPVRSGHGWAKGWSYAAAVVLLLGAGLVWKSGVGRRPATPDVATPVAMREYVTPRGERAQFRLPDGTRVMLSVASRLRLPLDYGVGERRLYLTGAAYFDVQHDANKRFFVHTGEIVTEDLGTRFGVRAYETDSTVQVAVAEGRVVLRSRREEMPLKQGELAVATASGQVVTPKDESIERVLAWTEGRIEFKSTPLAVALLELSRWFDLDFRLGDPALAELLLTGSFEDRPDEWMLKELALTLGVRAERRGRVVTFYPPTGVGQ